MQAIDIRRASSRPHTTLSWLDSWHSFSFGSHYDPKNTGHGLLLVNNDDRVWPRGAFGPHFHQDMEIVTWVLEGALVHEDSEGNHGELFPGLAQRMSAGTGIQHSEANPSATEPVHFIQMWVSPHKKGLAPGYEQRDVSASLAKGGLQVIASGQGHSDAVALNQRDAVLWVGRLSAGEQVTVPDGPHAHLFVARGTAVLDPGERLDEGDAARLTAAGAIGLTADGDGAEVLIWVTA